MLAAADADQLLGLAKSQVAETLRHLADSAVLVPGAT